LIWRAPLAFAADRVNRDHADRLVYAQFAGLSCRQLEADAEGCCTDLLLPSCFPEAISEMNAHRQAGRRLVLVSGGIEVVLAPLARALGADLLAQRLVTDGGRFTGAHLSYGVLDQGTPQMAQSARKAAALLRHAETVGLDLAQSYAYGDSVNDIGLLEAVGTPVAVNPDRALARIAAARQWEVRHWRMPRR